ncbi:MAG: integral membrane protein [Flavobacteriales bacterium]|jgi:integral membrane protein
MNHTRILRTLAVLEGISYLLLLGICMPLKYLFDYDDLTPPVGMAHGVLFVSYCVWVLIVGYQKKWSFKIVFLSGIASLLPFGTFVADKRWFRN